MREAALALGRRAIQLDPLGNNAPWHQLAVGMAESRVGDYAAAAQSLANASEGGARSADGIWRYYIPCTAGFDRAMCLYRLGRDAEAREHFKEAAARMKPLPESTRNPLSGEYPHDDLILWLALQAATAMVIERGASLP